MAVPAAVVDTRGDDVGYQLEGRILEVCDCNVLCPCWIGQDADNGTCDAVVAWHIDRGTIDGLDVSGRTLALLTHIPGNILKGNWRVVVFVDDQATAQQQEAILSVWTGRKGGPVADLAKLVGEVSAVERAPITFTVDGGRGTLRIGQTVHAELTPFQGATGRSTALLDTVFSTIAGSPAYVGSAPTYRVNAPQYGFNVDLHDHNAIQGAFSFVA